MSDGWSQDDEGYTFYRDREEWNDVTPIPQVGDNAFKTAFHQDLHFFCPE